MFIKIISCHPLLSLSIKLYYNRSAGNKAVETDKTASKTNCLINSLLTDNNFYIHNARYVLDAT